MVPIVLILQGLLQFNPTRNVTERICATYRDLGNALCWVHEITYQVNKPRATIYLPLSYSFSMYVCHPRHVCVWSVYTDHRPALACYIPFSPLR